MPPDGETAAEVADRGAAAMGRIRRQHARRLGGRGTGHGANLAWAWPAARHPGRRPAPGPFGQLPLVDHEPGQDAVAAAGTYVGYLPEPVPDPDEEPEADQAGPEADPERRTNGFLYTGVALLPEAEACGGL